MRNCWRAIVVLVIAGVTSLGFPGRTSATPIVILIGNCDVAMAQATIDAGTWYVEIVSGNQSRISPAITGPTTFGMAMTFSPPLAVGTSVVALFLDSSQRPTSNNTFYVCTSNAPLPCSNPDLIDGRLNATCADPVQTAALYCNVDAASLQVDLLRNSKGVFAFSITEQELDRFPTRPKVNTLIKQALGIQLWRLTTGELQFNTPHNDVYIFRHRLGVPVTFFQMCTGAAYWYRPS